MLLYMSPGKTVSEVNKVQNVMLYKHYGFDLLEEYIVPGRDFTIYAMLRKVGA